MNRVPRQLVYGHFVYDNSSTDISSTTVYQPVAQLYIQLLFQQIIIFINSNFYLHYDCFLSIPLPLPLLIIQHIVTCTAFPYVTLHSQPFPITRLVAVLCYTCYFVPPNGLNRRAPYLFAHLRRSLKLSSRDR